MKKFRFSLEPVLKHRERIEDARKADMAARQRELDAAIAELAALNDRYRAQSDLLRGEHKHLTVEELRSGYAHVEFLNRAINAQQALVDRRRGAVDRARVELLAASRDRKAVEKLKERRREAHDEGERRAEQYELDDGNARRYGRGKESA